MPDEGTPAGGTPANGTGEGTAGGTAGAGGSAGSKDGKSWGSFSDYLAGQDETVKGLYEADVKGLKTALDNERTAHKEQGDLLRELSAKVGTMKADEIKARIDEAIARADAAERRADFVEAAHGAGIGNVKLALHIVETEKLFNRKGDPDFEELRKGYPELFAGTKTASTKPAGNAGSGTKTAGKGAGNTMNDLIRSKFGR